MSVVIRELDNPVSVIPLLKSLHYDKEALKRASKSDINHLISRALNLTRSPDLHRKWCGINVIYVICDDYNVLASGGNNMLQQLIKILESYNATIDSKILTSTIGAINRLCDNIRGKPALTREILTPRLPTIISLYLEKLHFEPLLVVKSLHKLIKRHPTTFRTYANKTGAKLAEILVAADFGLPLELKKEALSTIASLPIVEKNEPEQKWESNVRNAIRELRSVIEIYGEFLHFDEDQDLKALIDKLPRIEDLKDLMFPALAVDVNDPSSLYQISKRVQVLLEILAAYAKTETQFSVKVPIGLFIAVIETVISVSTKFLKFKGDIRDQTVKDVINSTLKLNHEEALKFMQVLAEQYSGAIVPFFNDILGVLEFIVPFKDRTVNYSDLLNNENLYLQLLETVTVLLDIIENLGDASQLIRFVDVALILVEPRDESSEAHLSKNSNNNRENNGKNKKKKKSTNSASLSDLLSHKSLFQLFVPVETLIIVRKFFTSLIPRVNLPPTQHYKVTRYIIVEAVNACSANKEHKIPEDLTRLLEISLLHPGFETVSILPIVSSLLGSSPLVSLFNNPRLPPLPQYAKNIPDPEVEDEVELENVESVALKRTFEDQEESSSKRAKVVSEEISTPTDTLEAGSAPVPLVTVETTEINSEMIFKSPEEHQVIQFEETKKELKEETISTVVETITTEIVPEIAPPASVPTAVSKPASVAPSLAAQSTEIVEADEESDFEMPLLDDGADSSDEE